MLPVTGNNVKPVLCGRKQRVTAFTWEQMSLLSLSGSAHVGHTQAPDGCLFTHKEACVPWLSLTLLKQPVNHLPGPVPQGSLSQSHGGGHHQDFLSLQVGDRGGRSQVKAGVGEEALLVPAPRTAMVTPG